MQISATLDYLTVSVLDSGIITDFIRDDLELDDYTSAKGYKYYSAIKVPSLNDVEQFATLNYNSKSGMVIDMDKAFVSLGGKRLREVDGLGFLHDLGLPNDKTVDRDDESGRVTRCDIALDLHFGKGEQGQEQIDKYINTMIDVSGFSVEQNRIIPEKSKLRPGLDENGQVKKKRIESATLTMSEGATLKLGGKKSNFILTVYDKSAEINSKLKDEDKIDDKILRFEVRTKKELANDTARDLVRRFYTTNQSYEHKDLILTSEHLIKLWHTLVDRHLRIAKVGRGGSQSLWEFLGLGDKPDVIDMDYTKIEKKDANVEKWFTEQIAPTFKRTIINRMQTRTVEEFHAQVMKFLLDTELLPFADDRRLQKWIDDEFKKRGK